MAMPRDLMRRARATIVLSSLGDLNEVGPQCHGWNPEASSLGRSDPSGRTHATSTSHRDWSSRQASSVNWPSVPPGLSVSPTSNTAGRLEITPAPP